MTTSQFQTIFYPGRNLFSVTFLDSKKSDKATLGAKKSGNIITFDQAENRMHIQKSIILQLLGK
ncbi:MAG: hypothetical protein PHY34_04920 [Patescibacteria group bacterium]|nr:hypothetical protein [Patescibacteria group bacterium]MDD5715548.1 hypothetical protein [Patescibacteria group bacterium]